MPYKKHFFYNLLSLLTCSMSALLSKLLTKNQTTKKTQGTFFAFCKKKKTNRMKHNA